MKYKKETGLKAHSRWMRSIYRRIASSRNAVEVNWTCCCSSAQYRNWNLFVLMPSGPMLIPAHKQKKRSNSSLLRSERTHTKTHKLVLKHHFQHRCDNEILFLKTPQKVTQKTLHFNFCVFFLSILLVPIVHISDSVMPKPWFQKVALSGSLVLAHLN